MGMHYEVKVCINHKYDHFTGGKDVYDYLKQNINLQFNPFYNLIHDLVSNKWNVKENKIKNITCIFIKRKGEKRYIECIIALKLQNCKVIDRKSLKPNLTFTKSDPQYHNLCHIKLIE